jgi:chorismate dehydratase
VCKDFLESRDHGLAHREDLVHEWAPRIAVPEPTIRAYLTDNIHYVLDEDCIAAIEKFFLLAAECGVLPKAPPLRFLE